MSEGIRATEAPLDHGVAMLVAALMKRLGTERVELLDHELRDVEVVGTWDYATGTVTMRTKA